jgi:LPS-assembly lipoprotein
MKKSIISFSANYSSKRRECLGGGLALVAAGVLSACGWRIRGKIDLPYKNLLVSGVMTPEFRNDLEMYLRMNDVNLVTRAQDAEVILEIMSFPKVLLKLLLKLLKLKRKSSSQIKYRPKL